MYTLTGHKLTIEYDSGNSLIDVRTEYGFEVSQQFKLVLKVALSFCVVLRMDPDTFVSLYLQKLWHAFELFSLKANPFHQRHTW